ncbi:hypothetical protein B7991_05670 [Fibrobacter sp. UWB3]|nr:hypothetical protein B7991_05670 [Fibrobacter sp. UWB3]
MYCNIVNKLIYENYIGESLRLLSPKRFHVKPYEASEAETNIFVSISEPIKVGHEVSQHSRGFRAKMCLRIFIWKLKGVGL